MSPSPQSIPRSVDCGTSLRCEKNRLATFDSWPSNAPVAKECLARAGFFFKRAPLCVECFCCGGIVSEWCADDSCEHSESSFDVWGVRQLMLLHRQLFPSCSFVSQRSNNVPAIRVNTAVTSQESQLHFQDSGYTSTASSGGEAHSPVSSQNSIDSTSSSLSSDLHYPSVNLDSTEPSHTHQPPLTPDNGSVSTSSTGVDQAPDSTVTSGGGSRGWQQLIREVVRRRSFICGGNWRSTVVSGDDLAAAGFVAMGDGDKVQCVFCRGVIGNWESGDVPLDEHRRHFPLCPFVRGSPVGNIPVEVDSDDNDSDSDSNSDQEDEGQQHTGQDVCGWGPMPPSLISTDDGVGWRLDYRTNSQPENANAGYLLSQDLNVRRVRDGTSSSGHSSGDDSVNGGSSPSRGGASGDIDQLLSSSDLTGLGIDHYHGPKHPCYATLEARLRTYQHWPPGLAQTPRQLSDAGFFYLGVSDHVKCFHCDGALRDWLPSDKPWLEHARWYSTCGFLRLIKGPDFINSVLRPGDSESECSTPHTTRPALTAPSGVRNYTEQQIDDMMQTAICETAVQLGLPRDTVRRALCLHLQNTGSQFDNVSDLLTAANNIQSSTASSVNENTSSHSTGPSPPSNITLRSNQLSDSKVGDSACETSVEPSSSGLEEEFRRLRDQKQCKVCMDRDVGVVFLPCGHLITCVLCAPALANCPLCRQTIRGAVRTFMS